VKLSELFKSCVVAAGNSHPAIPQAEVKKHEDEVDGSFDMLDGTNPEKPYSSEVIMKAMAELNKRVHKQAANYGGKIDPKTGKIDLSAHKFYDAQIARDE